MLYANLMVLSFIVPALWAIAVHLARIGILDVFSSCYFDPMTFIHDLDQYCLELYRICKYELPTSRLSKVIV